MSGLTQRQEKILETLVAEYIKTAEPVSSKLLVKRGCFKCSAPTIRNEFQELSEMGFIEQPHTSSGRVPTQRAYQYFADKIEAEKVLDEFIMYQITQAHNQMEQEMRQMEELMRTLEKGDMFEILNILDSWHKKMWNN